MSRLLYVNDLFCRAATIAAPEATVELTAVGDPVGAALDRAIRELTRDFPDPPGGPLGDLLSMSRRLRWRLSVEPCPGKHALGRQELVGRVVDLCQACRLMVDEKARWILDELARAATALDTQTGPPVGEVLLQNLREAGLRGCATVAAGHLAATAIQSWFIECGIDVPVYDFRRPPDRETFDIEYLAGAPRVFGPTVLAAPRAGSLSYIFPAWFQDRSLPLTEFSRVAEGGIRPRLRSYRIGEAGFLPDRLRDTPDQLMPVLPVHRRSPDTVVSADEAHARRIWMCGGLSILLELDGETIRTIDPTKPTGRRVEMLDVEDVRPGTFLVLREGQTDSSQLYARAVTLLGARASAVAETQAAWKAALRHRIERDGPAAVVRSLRRVGVQAAGQAPTWTAETLARPQRDEDFAALLSWLGLPLDPYYENAQCLRGARSQAMSDIRTALEEALASADMAALEAAGYLRLDLELEGFAGILASRVTAVSPVLEVVSRSELRIPRRDESAPWLE